MVELSSSFLNRLSSIFADVAQVLFAGLVVPFFLGFQDFRVALLGLAASAFLWILSLWFAKV